MRQLSMRSTGMWAGVLALALVVAGCDRRDEDAGDQKQLSACKPPTAKDTGLAGRPQDHPAATVAYVAGLCFEQGSQFSATAPRRCRGGACTHDVKLRLSAEYRTIKLPSTDLRQRGRVLAMITNVDTSSFMGWAPELTPRDSAYLWVGPIGSAGDAYTIVFTVNTVDSTVRVLRTGTEYFRAIPYPIGRGAPPVATARWDAHIHTQRSVLPGRGERFSAWNPEATGLRSRAASLMNWLRQVGAVRTANAATLDFHDASWISCLDGCCVAGDVYE